MEIDVIRDHTLVGWALIQHLMSWSKEKPEAQVEHHVEVMLLQTKEHQELLETARSGEKGMEQVLPWNLQREHGSADTLILDF